MKNLEKKMRELEYYHSLKVPPDAWTIIRVDGRSFSRLTKERDFEKPFDSKFNEIMVKVSQHLLEELNGVYVYTESDEISILLPRAFNLFSRKVEKLVSISAGIASASMSLQLDDPVHFDSRVWIGMNEGQVFDYFLWRQADATRCALNGYAYWTLRKQGLSARKAAKQLDKAKTDYKNELLFQNGINFNDVPLWQRRGVGIYWETYMKAGYNPEKDMPVLAKRRRQKIDKELPMRIAYCEFLRDHVGIFNE